MIKCENYNECTNTNKQYYCQHCERNINKVKTKDYYNYNTKFVFDIMLESAKHLGITKEQLKCAVDIITAYQKD